MRRKVHNYTSNLELTSLLIRIKNLKNNLECFDSEHKNRMINKYVKWHTDLNDKRYDISDCTEDQDNESGSCSSSSLCSAKNARKRDILHRVKDRIIYLSERTPANEAAYNRFGQIILLMVKHILTMPKFSGYSYKDDFYSDSVYKILKYLYNFDHTMISEKTGRPVNAFAYISQIIHNSIIYVINTRKKERNNVLEQAKFNVLQESFSKSGLKNNLYITDSVKEPEPEKIEKTEFLKSNENIVERIKNSVANASENVARITFMIPKDVQLSANEYYDLEELKKKYKILNLGARY